MVLNNRPEAQIYLCFHARPDECDLRIHLSWSLANSIPGRWYSSVNYGGKFAGIPLEHMLQRARHSNLTHRTVDAKRGDVGAVLFIPDDVVVSVKPLGQRPSYLNRILPVQSVCRRPRATWVFTIIPEATLGWFLFISGCFLVAP